ncbi:group-specific protein [Solibacillus isronensis]
MDMGTGFKVSLIAVAVEMLVLFSILIPFFRKHIVRENKKINYAKTTIFLRWNVFDAVTLILAVYTIVCVQALNILLSFGKTIENPYVQFFTNQAQAWVIVMVVYLVMRISFALKSIKARFGDIYDGEQ